jgi:succinyl-diaminopimelate desuccinylase
MPRYAGAVTPLAERLAARTLELVDIPSESRHEEAIREHLLALVPSSYACAFAGDEVFLFAPERRPGRPLVVLAGHYDTVPAQENLPGRIEDGAVHGLGASDMKGGVAVALELVRDLAETPGAGADVALLVFGREELPVEHDPLPALLESSELVHETALAILLEPTDGVVHAGCLGNVIARLTFHGRSGHSARPWDADSAIAHAVEGLRPLLALEPRRAAVGGLPFVEVLSVTRLESGIADNVIPDRATATLNLRYPPDRTAEDAEALLHALAPGDATLDIVSHAPAGAVVTDNPVLAALVGAGAREVQPKQAWTNVADFTAHGIDAVNFGPGHTRYAHRRDEQVEIAALVHAYETLDRLVRGSIGEDGQ